MSDPVIVTLALDAASQAFFDAVRRAHFPPERLMVDAHLTLYHKLPGDAWPGIASRLAEAALATPPLPVRAEGIVRLNRGGVAYGLAAPGAKSLKARLDDGWPFELAAQDRGGLRPHVTVQNRVAPEVAEATASSLRATFAPFEGRLTALAAWWYRGGPWEAAGRWELVGAPPAPGAARP